MPGLPPIVFSASSPALMRYLFKCCKVYKFFIFEFLFKISLYQLLKTKIPFFLFMIKIIKKIMNDSFFKNLIFLIISKGIFSVLGLNIALIKYLPHAKDKSKKINTSFTIVAIVSVIVASVYLLGIERFSPDLLFIKENLILAFSFILFMVLSSFNSISESVFVAFRNTKYILIKNTIFSGSKIIIPFGFVALGFVGAYVIFSSWMIGLFISFCFSIFILVKKFNYEPKFVYHSSIIEKIGKYSFGNYLAGFIGGLPLMILPLMITNIINPTTTAYYYIAMMIAGLLFAVPAAATQSLFAEGSHNEKELGKQIKKAVKIIALILIPGILITIFFGQYILLAFGKEYSSEGMGLLRILAVSGIFVSANSIFGNILRVRNRIFAFVSVNILRAVVMIGSIYLLVDKGLVGVGYGWLIGSFATTLFYIGVLLVGRR